MDLMGNCGRAPLHYPLISFLEIQSEVEGSRLLPPTNTSQQRVAPKRVKLTLRIIWTLTNGGVQT